MTPDTLPNRLDRPVDEAYDHILGPSDAEITLVEYGSYGDPSCGAAHERIAEIRSGSGNRLRYRIPSPAGPRQGYCPARRRAGGILQGPGALLERACRADDTLRRTDRGRPAYYRRRQVLDERGAASGDDGMLWGKSPGGCGCASAAASGVLITPTFFINGRRYDGPWDADSFSEAMLGSPAMWFTRSRWTLPNGRLQRASCCCWLRLLRWH